MNPADGGAGDQFGRSVSLHGQKLLAGAWRDAGVGSAYVFTRQGQEYSETAKLVADVPTVGFGWSVAVRGNTSVIGSPFSDATFTFQHNAGGWQGTATLVGNDTVPGDSFGRSVSIHGGTILVGAPLASAGSTTGGAAYAFRRSGGQWTEHAKLTASDADSWDGYGISVSLAGSRALIGAWADGDGGSSAGAAYVEPIP